MKILDSSNVSVEAAQAWARKRNSHERFVNVAPLYWQIAPRYGIPPEIAYAQASHETDKGKYTGVVPADYHNWCGLKTKQGGSNDAPQAHMRFPDDATGVLAHVQHLARYAGIQALPAGDVLVDPRWSLVTKFTDTVEGLGGAWAPAANYGQTIANLATDLRDFANNGTWEPPMYAQIPGFEWFPADADHYQRGRTQKIRGGAQHYTAGTNSLNWLAKTSKPEVSVHFLVKHNPTMEDRGWQLVKIEDTAWTTAYANPYTVAIEYEHDGRQSIPDIAYEVLAETWFDITLYVRHQNLGDIETIAGHKVWVNNPQLVCPDGIDVARIVKRWNELMYGDPQPSPPPADQFPKTQPDPWGTTHWIPDVFVAEIRKHDWMLTGFAVSEMFREGPLLVQYFERARLELHPGGAVMRGHVGREAMVARYPERK